MKRPLLSLLILFSLYCFTECTLWSHKHTTKDSSHSNSTSSLTPQARIVGGSQPGRNDYPQFVRLDEIPNSRHCAGTLIHPWLVISAAHCYVPPNTLKAVVNAYSTYNDYYDSQQYIRYISEAVVHPSFLPGGDQSQDVMILKLSEPIPDTISPVKLNKAPQKPAEGAALTIIGMGKTQEEGQSSTMLQEATVYAYSGQDCLQKLEAPFQDSTMFCAGVDAGGVDACNGDSGGGILFQGTDTLAGITSWGRGCARAEYPGVYARVSANINWIETQMCALAGAACPTPPPTTATPTPNPTVKPTLRPTTPAPTAKPTVKPTLPPTTPAPVPTTPPPVAPTPKPTLQPTPERLVDTTVIKRDELCQDSMQRIFWVLGYSYSCFQLATLPMDIQIRICNGLDGNDSMTVCPYTCGASCGVDSRQADNLWDHPHKRLRQNGNGE